MRSISARVLAMIASVTLAACEGPKPGHDPEPGDGDDSASPSLPEDTGTAPPDDDLDDDGYAQGDDCDDDDASINPDADEVCDDLDVDEDCDGLADDADDSVRPAGMSRWPLDDDDDGYAGGTQLACDPLAGELAEGHDCDDADGAVHPGASEDCSDGIDNDCSGLLDCEELACETDGSCFEYGCSDGLDDDDDGHVDCDDDDCWGAGCTGARVRVSGGSMHAQVRRDAGGDWTSGWDSGCSDSGSWRSFSGATADLTAITGTVQVATSRGYDWASCAWSLDGVAISAWDVWEGGHTSDSTSGGRCTDTAWESTWTRSGSPLRSGFSVADGCGLSGSSFLPAVLTRPTLGPDAPAWQVDGRRWYTGEGTLTWHVTYHSYDPWSDDEYTAQSWSVPTLEVGSWVRVP